MVILFLHITHQEPKHKDCKFSLDRTWVTEHFKYTIPQSYRKGNNFFYELKTYLSKQTVNHVDYPNISLWLSLTNSKAALICWWFCTNRTNGNTQMSQWWGKGIEAQIVCVCCLVWNWTACMFSCAGVLLACKCCECVWWAEIWLACPWVWTVVGEKRLCAHHASVLLYTPSVTSPSF